MITTEEALAKLIDDERVYIVETFGTPHSPSGTGGIKDTVRFSINADLRAVKIAGLMRNGALQKMLEAHDGITEENAMQSPDSMMILTRDGHIYAMDKVFSMQAEAVIAMQEIIQNSMKSAIEEIDQTVRCLN